MAEQLQEHGKPSGGTAKGMFGWMPELFGSRFFVFFYDYAAMRFSSAKRYRELSYDHLVCRFCGYTIDLLGAWKCQCGYTRPGNYFGRCPGCLARSRHIDCPACRFTMDVR